MSVKEDSITLVRRPKEEKEITLCTSIHQSELSASMEELPGLVQNLITLFESSPTALAYQEGLDFARSKSTDLLESHQHQVSAVAVLMALSMGDFSQQDLYDLAGAGRLHDLGLKRFDPTAPEDPAHIKKSLDRIKKEKIPITPGVLRIIELHHENWDGTGYKGYPSLKIYRPARIFRIADDFVTLLQDQSLRMNYFAAIDLLSAREGCYDPIMIEVLLKR